MSAVLGCGAPLYEVAVAAGEPGTKGIPMRRSLLGEPHDIFTVDVRDAVERVRVIFGYIPEH